jgi:hypothetical protein
MGSTVLGLVLLSLIGGNAPSPTSSWRAVPDGEAAQLMGGECVLHRIRGCDGGYFGCRILACYRKDPLGRVMNDPNAELKYCGAELCGFYVLRKACVD